MSKGKFPLTCKTSSLPRKICFDTSLLIEVYFAGAPLRAECEAFLVKLIKYKPTRQRYITSTVLCEMFDSIMYYEISRQKLAQGLTRPKRWEGKFGWKDCFKYYKKRFDMKAIEQELDRFLVWLGNYGILVLPQTKAQAIDKPIKSLIVNYKLMQADARIVIEAAQYRIKCIATLDKDFLNVDNLTVFTHY